MTGEKLKPLVIAKSRQPRCFKGIDSSKLPVHYKFNKKAWMNSSVFEVWIQSVDRKMKREGRKILMFIDNAPSHPKMKLDNVKLVFLPPNTTSKIQPMDQGIIQAMKLKFHKRQSRKILAEMEKHKDMCGSELLKQITVLDAIYWVKNSWDEVESSTIVKCFAKCGFKFSDSENVDSEVETPDIDEDIPLRLVSLANELFGCEFSELVEIEREIPTCDETMDWDRPVSELLQEHVHETETVSDNSDDESCDSVEPVCSLNEVEDFLDKLKGFALAKGQSSMLTNLMEISEMATSLRIETSCQQSKISDFFKKC